MAARSLSHSRWRLRFSTLVPTPMFLPGTGAVPHSVWQYFSNGIAGVPSGGFVRKAEKVTRGAAGAMQGSVTKFRSYQSAMQEAPIGGADVGMEYLQLGFGLLHRDISSKGGYFVMGRSTIGAYSESKSWGRKTFSSNTAVLQKTEVLHKSLEQAAHIGYHVVGTYVPEGNKKIQPQAAFAVVQVGSHQFKVTPGDLIYTEKLKFADINDMLCLNKVLMLGSLTQTIVGRPIIPKASVFATVEEHALDAKVIVFKKKRRKNYRRTNGHRQELTRLRILNIDGIDSDIIQATKTSS